MNNPGLKTVLASALVASTIVFAACEKNPVDAVLENVVNWEGYFMASDGTVIQLDGSDAFILKVGSVGIKKVNDKYMIGMAPTGNKDGEFRGYSLTKSGFYDFATVQLTGNSLTLRWDKAGDVVSTQQSWSATSKPTPIPSPSTGGGPTTPPTGSLTTLLSQSGIEGNEKSSRFYTITVPAGTTRLYVQTTEDTGGRNLADLFVRRGSQPSVNNANEQYTWTAECASVLPNRESEVCSFSNPPAGTWYILLYGYHAYWGTTLKATITK